MMRKIPAALAVFAIALVIVTGCAAIESREPQVANGEASSMAIIEGVLSVRRLQVVDAEGIVRMVLSVDDSGEPFIQLQGAASGASVRIETIGESALLSLGGGNLGTEQLLEFVASNEYVRVRMLRGQGKWPGKDPDRGGVLLVSSDEEGPSVIVYQDGKEDAVLRPKDKRE